MSISLTCFILDDVITVRLSDPVIVDKTENTEVEISKLKISDLREYIWRKEKLETRINNHRGMSLWKVNVCKDKLEGVSTEEEIRTKLEGKKIDTNKLFRNEEYFPADHSSDTIENVHIIVIIPATELERKRKNTEVETTSRKRREWTINSTIMNEMRNLVYFVDLAETSRPLYNMIQRGEFIALYGARASRKSTRVDQAIIELQSEGYVCIYISFEGSNMSTMNTFWSSIGTKLSINAPKYFEINDVKSADDFTFKFQKSNWKSNVVLFIDEYDALLEANDDIKSSFLGAIRNIKNSKRDYAIWSSVAIGPLSILFLKSDKINVSPFNVKFRNPNFTLAQVESIYKDYGDDNKLTIVPEVIKDIRIFMNGRTGMLASSAFVARLSKIT